MAETPHQLQHAAREREQAAADHLSRLNGAQSLQAGVLALLLPPNSRRGARAWSVETAAWPGAAALREHVEALAPAARLPWLDVLLQRMRGQPLSSRQLLLAATRRVMAARRVVRPLDRLHWMVMRQRLGEPTAATRHEAAAAELACLPAGDVLALARTTAFLARMVPTESPQPADRPGTGNDRPDHPANPADPGEPVGPVCAAGIAWYASAMERWQQGEIPPCRPPDSEGLVQAVQELQALAWMQRPVLARDWVGAAVRHSPHGRLTDSAADALRLGCALLDSPLPPELERHYAGATPEGLVVPPAAAAPGSRF
jgi:hypothetical protein